MRRWPVLTHPAALLAKKGAPCNLVFVGDSITQMWGGEPRDRPQPGAAVWEERFARRAAVNLGYGWDRTENVLWRLRVGGELEGCAGAKLGVLLIGADPLQPGVAEFCLQHALLARSRHQQPGPAPSRPSTAAERQRRGGGGGCGGCA